MLWMVLDDLRMNVDICQQPRDMHQTLNTIINICYSLVSTSSSQPGMSRLCKYLNKAIVGSEMQHSGVRSLIPSLLWFLRGATMSSYWAISSLIAFTDSPLTSSTDPFCCTLFFGESSGSYVPDNFVLQPTAFSTHSSPPQNLKISSAPTAACICNHKKIQAFLMSVLVLRATIWSQFIGSRFKIRTQPPAWESERRTASILASSTTIDIQLRASR